jgi:hypothetical protein
MIERKQTFSTRRDGVVVEELGGELLVYDRETDVAHCLSEVAAVAWRSFDGGATVDHAAGQILATGLASSLDEARTLADAAVAELDEKGLLKETPGFVGEPIPRRQALRRIAGAGAGLAAAPLIVSAAVPVAAAASSKLPSNVWYCKTFGGSTYCFEINTGPNTCSEVPAGGFPPPKPPGCAKPPYKDPGCADSGNSYVSNYSACQDVTWATHGGTVYVASTINGETPAQSVSFALCGCSYYKAGSGSGTLPYSGNNGNGNGAGYLTFTCPPPTQSTC